MKKLKYFFNFKFFLPIAFVLLLPFFAILVQQQQNYKQDAAASSAVSIQDFQFSPATITVPVGSTVTWTNRSANNHHTTTSDVVGTPNSWDSGLTNPGTTFSKTFTAPGTYTYHCNVHTFMRGTVVVTAGNPVTTAPSASPNPTVRITQPPLTTISPSPSEIITPTSVPNPSISLPIETDTPTPTGDTGIVSPTDTIVPSSPDIILSASITLPGIGSKIVGANSHPLHPLRNISLWIYNIVTGNVIAVQTTMLFNGNYFINPSIDLGILPPGYYQIFLKTNGYLTLRLLNATGENTFQFAAGTTLILPPNVMIPGDIAPFNSHHANQNAFPSIFPSTSIVPSPTGTTPPVFTYGDNSLSLEDYNMLIGCYLTKADTNSCISKTAADLDDNGVIDGIDYNIMLKGFSESLNGDVVPTTGTILSPTSIPTPTQ